MMLESSQIMAQWKDYVDPSFEHHGLREAFEELARPDFSSKSKMELIAGDASDRKFYRYKNEDFLAICMQFPKWEGGYGGDPMSWLGMQSALSQMGLPVPRVLSVDEANKCIWTEDFGQDFLNCHMTEGPLSDHLPSCADSINLYEQALDLLVDAQYPTVEAPSHPALSRAFDFEKLHFEMQFFLKHFLCSFLGLSEEDALVKNVATEFLSLCQWLSDRPRVLCHRDYHVRNVMVVSGKAKWIDFQDARMGPHTYDVVSLLRDSYVEIEKSTRNRLALKYLQSTNLRRKAHRLDPLAQNDFWLEFQKMGLQRNIKALGSFGYLATEKGKPDYLKYVVHTLQTILDQSIEHSELGVATEFTQIHALVESLQCGKFAQKLQQKIKGLLEKLMFE